MTYQYSPENLIKTQHPEEWAEACAYMASQMIRTACLALDNDGSGLCSIEERAASVSTTLEVSQALMAIVIDGTEGLGRKVGAGIWKKEDAA